MQTNILGPKDAPYVNTLTDLEELTKKETAILLACVQDYYHETIHRLALAISEPHGEDELAFLACVITQFYLKSEIELPEMLLKIANMDVPIVDETTDLIVLFLVQIDKGFRGVVTDGITEAVKEAAEKRTTEVIKELENTNSSDRDHIRLAILADELSNHEYFNVALGIYKMAKEIKSKHQFIDFKKWQNAKIFDKAYKVGSLIKAFNKNLPESESDLLNQLFKVSPLHKIEIEVRLRKVKEERQREENALKL